MDPKHMRPRSNLQFAKQVKPTSVGSSLIRKNEALEKMKGENEELKEEIKRLKYRKIFAYDVNFN